MGGRRRACPAKTASLGGALAPPRLLVPRLAHRSSLATAAYGATDAPRLLQLHALAGQLAADAVVGVRIGAAGNEGEHPAAVRQDQLHRAEPVDEKPDAQEVLLLVLIEVHLRAGGETVVVC